MPRSLASVRGSKGGGRGTESCRRSLWCPPMFRVEKKWEEEIKVRPGCRGWRERTHLKPIAGGDARSRGKERARKNRGSWKGRSQVETPLCLLVVFSNRRKKGGKQRNYIGDRSGSIVERAPPLAHRLLKEVSKLQRGRN